MPSKLKHPFDRASGSDRDYSVGYGKPPEATRFKPGRSGNPKGRPKGARNTRPALNEERLKKIVLDEAYRKIKVADGNKVVSIPMAQAIIRTLAVNAAKGQPRATKLFTEMVSATEATNRAVHEEYVEAAIEYKLGWEAELERRKLLGITGPDPLPHPDDIIIHRNADTVALKGPLTREEKQTWDRLIRRFVDGEREIEELKKILKNPKLKCDYRDMIESDLKWEIKFHERLKEPLSELPYVLRNIEKLRG
jgi:Family of unknown function (DUF5681)